MSTLRLTRRGRVVKNVALFTVVAGSTGAFLALLILTTFAYWSPR